jgi:hypothetical protein
LTSDKKRSITFFVNNIDIHIRMINEESYHFQVGQESEGAERRENGGGRRREEKGEWRREKKGREGRKEKGEGRRREENRWW